jgi:hypothetical protein
LIVLVGWKSVSICGGSGEVSVVGSSWARGGRALVEVGGEAVILFASVVEDVGIFWSANEIGVSVFLGEDLVFLCWF